MTQTMMGGLYVGLGTLLVASGGLLATYGWQRVSSGRQWQNSIRSVAREMAINEQMIDVAMGRIALVLSGENKSKHLFTFEDFQDVQLTAALTSGVLNPNSPDDRQLVDTITKYRQLIARFNGAQRVLGHQNDALYVKSEYLKGDEPPTDVSPIEGLSRAFGTLVECHKNAKSELESRYPWAF